MPTPTSTVAQCATGTVKWFDPKKGHGFIGVDDGGADAFAHYADLGSNVPTLTIEREHQQHGSIDRKVLYAGQKVEFEIVQTAKGRRAVNVKVLAA